MKRNIIILLILMDLLASVCFAQSPVVSQQKTTPLEKYLNPDGTINTKLGFTGSLDPKGYRMTTGQNGEPRFVRPGKVVPTSINFEYSEWDPRFSQPGVNGSVNAIYVDGYNACVYIGGWFTHVGEVNANNVAVWRGNQWDSLGSGTNGQIYAVHAYTEGSSVYIVFGGSISVAGGISVNNIAKWDPVYKNWSTLGTGVNGPVYALDFGTGGSDLFVGGSFTNAGGLIVNNIARYYGFGSWSQMRNGTNIGTDGAVFSLLVVDDVVYAGGQFTTAGGVTANAIAKYAVGAWSALGSGLTLGYYYSPRVYALSSMGTSIYAAGDFSDAGGVNAVNIARWDGASWHAVGSTYASGFSFGYSDILALVNDGTSLYAGGQFTTVAGKTVNYIAKWNGSSWDSLGVGGDNTIRALAVYNQTYPYPEQLIPNSTLCVGGEFQHAGGLMSRGFATWHSDKWSASGNGVSAVIVALAAIGNDVYAGGDILEFAGGVHASGIARWNGTHWDSLGSGVNNTVYAIAVSGTDVYVGGNFDQAGGVSASCVAKWNGSNWSPLGFGTNGDVFALAVIGTDLYAGGGFTTAGGVPVNHIAKWNGTTWSALGSGTSGYGEVFALLAVGTDLYVGGRFTTAGGVSANHVAKWNGSAWSPLGVGLGSGMTDRVSALAIIGSDLYAGGDFTTSGSVEVNHIAKWNGSSWSALGSGMDRRVWALAVNGSDLYAGGAFTTAGGVTVNCIAKWSGTMWDSLEGGVVGGEVNALTTSRGAVYVGGGFSKAGYMQSKCIARWGLPYKSGGMIAGKVFIDTNKNGVQDPGEQGSPWASLIIVPANNPFDFSLKSTDNDGDYYFDGLADNRYIVMCEPDPSSKQSYPSGGNGSYTIDITDGNVVLGNNFGVYSAIVAHYPLMGTANDTTGNYGPMTLSNTPFQPEGGIYCDGTYGTTQAFTPYLHGLDYGNFSILTQFKITEYPTSGTRRPVIVGGQSNRWLGFQILSNGTVAMTYNNDSIKNSSVVCTLDDPHSALITYDSSSRIARFYLDDIFAGSDTFSLQTAGGVDEVVLISDLSIGATFKGTLWDLMIVNNDISPWMSSTQTPSFITGTVYNDQNGNGFHDPGESGLSGWSIHLRTGNPPYDRDTITGADGKYSFSTEFDYGVITLSETVPDDWVQTSPSSPGTNIVAISSWGMVITGMDFGNKTGYRYIGPVGGNWSNPANWSGGHVPQPNEIVVIPVDVIVDALPNDSIMGLRILSGATLTFSASAPPLKISGDVKIGGGGAVVFPTLTALEKFSTISAGSIGMICYQDWVNLGAFTAGSSTITFAGDKSKSIGTSNFNNLEISGTNTVTNGNLGITNLLMLHQKLNVSSNDTVIVINNALNAIQDTGRIIGTMKRHIAPGETGSYRFESPLTTVKFNGMGSYPSAVTMTMIPDLTPPSFNLDWQLVGGIADPVQNIVTYDSAKHFSKWVFGTPRPISVPDPESNLSIDPTPAGIGQEVGNGIPVIRRLYTIDADGGSNYEAQLSLRYDQSEVPMGTSEADLKLLRGPFYQDSVHAGWNIVSLPLVPHSTLVDSVFPTATSRAFAYIGSYTERSELKFGEGYWLKLPDSHNVLMMGTDLDEITLDVRSGWNLIGAISYPVSVASVVSFPPDIIVSDFFGYTTSYELVDSLKPMRAYWVNVNSSGKLLLSAFGIGALPKTARTRNELNDLNAFTICDAKDNKHTLYFDTRKNVNPSNYELPPTPPTGIFDVRYSTGKYVATPYEKVNEYTIQISAAQYPVSINWEIKNIAEGSFLFVDDKPVNISKNGSIQIDDPKSLIKLKLSSDITGEIPKEFALSQNYPNPFNPVTSIGYSLPVKSIVRLKIFNVLGQEVQAIVDELQDEGNRVAEWNASGFASGVYYYQLNATAIEGTGKTFTQVKKMILLK